MKKRILGLALALVMIISLLPLTALADGTPMPKYVIRDGEKRLEYGIIPNSVRYIVFEDVKDEAGAVIGNTPVNATDVPEDNYIKLEFVDGVCIVTFKNVNYKRTAGTNDFLQIYNNSKYTSDFDVVLKLEGENKLEGNNTKITITNTGDLTITGEGSLKIYSKHTSNQMIQKLKEGNLYIKNTTLDIEVYNEGSSVGTTGSLVAEGAITIEGSTVIISGSKNYGIVTGTKYSAPLEDTEKGITIKNSNVSVTAGSIKPISTNGKIVIENSNVEFIKGTGNTTSFATSMPYVTGCATVELKKASGKTPSYKDASEYEIAAGTALTADDAMVGFKTTHECVAQADDGDCTTAVTCACGKVYTAAKEHAGVVTDCAKDVACTNAGCTKLYKAAGAHEAAEDDGDCTTAVKCKNCEAIAVAAAEHKGGEATCTAKAKCETCGKEYGEMKAHTYTRTDCAVDATCSVCNEVVVKGGEHAGGTATCKEKAKCATCGAEYGELAECKAAAEDGDCTTAIACTICGKVITAGQDAHKYTDNADTTCDNEGCTVTRVVDVPSTDDDNNGNNQTGDNTPLVLFVSLMVASAAAFVCIKKFAVR